MSISPPGVPFPLCLPSLFPLEFCFVSLFVSFPLPAVLMPVSCSPSCSFVCLYSSYVCFLSTCAFLLLIAAFFILASFVLCFTSEHTYIYFVFLFSGLGCVVVFLYPVRWHLTCFTHEFAMIFLFLVLLWLTVCGDIISISRWIRNQDGHY